ncbi:MAG: histidine triad nucleotide-binding protein [Chloroflexi bacterium]|nr:histidine triad nucleotide-binding protein [Chloroflexota bacterium]MCY3957821.1 histidine triad nucleotide-binding protein [Chloroflexota bacterium]
MTANTSGADCIFCAIARGDIPSEGVYADDHVVAFRDINPQAPAHVLVVPRRHVSSIDALKDDPELLGRIMAAAVTVAQAENLAASGYRLATNHGRDGAQTVPHLHVHVLGGRSLNGRLG